MTNTTSNCCFKCIQDSSQMLNVIIIYTRKKLKKMTHLSNTFNFSWKHKSFPTLFLYPLFATVFLMNAHQKRGEFADTVSKFNWVLSLNQTEFSLFVCLSFPLLHTHTQSKRFLQFAHWLTHSEKV